jgi:fructose-1,6-bisphosphatase/inositol monophosphatase family enzyme
MAIGTVGLNKTIKSGARVTIFLIVPLNILNYILDDKQTMFRLLGTTATDLIKVGAGAAVASLIATSVATITTIAAGPLVVAIAVGIATGFTLDLLDQKFGITEALVKALAEVHDSTIGEFGRQINKVEKRLKWQIMNGKPVGKGIFY